jgi:NAD kinase
MYAHASTAANRKIILVTRRTRLDELVTRYNTVEQARFYIEHLGEDFDDYLVEHSRYRAAVAQGQAQLEALCRVQVVSRAYLPNFIFAPDDVVVAIGPDGLVANTLKYLSGQPLIGANPDILRWDGILLPFLTGDLGVVAADVLANRRPIREVTMAQATLSDGQTLRAVNDLFIGRRSHVSARYGIDFAGQRENQSSSGIIVSTGLGSTGWLTSIISGAAAITSAVLGDTSVRSTALQLPWDTDSLVFTVREPFPSQSTQAETVFGLVTATAPLSVVSQMPEDGVIFSDGIECDFLEFTSGLKAHITLAPQRGYLVA